MKKLKFGFKILFLLILSFLVKRFRHIPRNPANLLGFVCWQIFTITAMHCTSHLTSRHMPPSIFNAYIFFTFLFMHSIPSSLSPLFFSNPMPTVITCTHSFLSFLFVCLFVCFFLFFLPSTIITRKTTQSFFFSFIYFLFLQSSHNVFFLPHSGSSPLQNFHHFNHDIYIMVGIPYLQEKSNLCPYISNDLI